MKSCLKCGKQFIEKRDTAKFCSVSCRVIWNRNPKNKKDKPLSDSQQMKVMYNALMEKIDKLVMLPVFVPPVEQNTKFNGFIQQIEEKPKKIHLKRTPAHWVELRRECENADDYQKWLEDLESNPYLTHLEKKQIKATT